MALGGGTWAVQNKVLPGTYINFSSTAKATSALSERGIAAIPLSLDWGPEGAVFTVDSADFQRNALALFGHNYGDEEMLPLREIFRNAKTLHIYRLNDGGTAATNKFGTARYPGTAGNKLSNVVAKNVDDTSKWDVSTLYGTTVVDIQTVGASTELVPTDFIGEWKSVELTQTAKTPLTTGANGSVATKDYQAALDSFEAYSFNALACPTVDPTTVSLFVAYTKRMREEIGANFQTVIYNAYASDKVADYEGVIEVANTPVGDAFGLVYWVTGVSAGCPVNKSNTNRLYDGELTIGVDFTQSELSKGIKAGRFMFHDVNGEIRVLEDINSMTTTTDTKGEDFKSNQTVRVCDQIATDIAVTFNTRYLGQVPNDNDGRIALWADVCHVLDQLQTIRAVEDYNPDAVRVELGETKKSVVCTIGPVAIVNAMAQLYVRTIIK